MFKKDIKSFLEKVGANVKEKKRKLKKVKFDLSRSNKNVLRKEKILKYM